MKKNQNVLILLMVLLTFCVTTLAQSPNAPKRFRGVIESVMEGKIIFKERSGETLHFKLQISGRHVQVCIKIIWANEKRAVICANAIN